MKMKKKNVDFFQACLEEIIPQALLSVSLFDPLRSIPNHKIDKLVTLFILLGHNYLKLSSLVGTS